MMLPKKISKDYFFTFATEFIVLLAGILVYKLAANVLGNNGFAEYAISRRTISFIQPLLIIGLGVGIPRYIAFATADKTYKEAGSYFLSGFLIIHILTILFLLAFNIFSTWFSFLIFGDERFQNIIPYLSIMLLGMVGHSTAYGYLRGRLKMMQANLLQLINLGITPLVVFYFANDIQQILLFTGATWSCISMLAILSILISSTWKKENLLPAGKELLIYGTQRVPGDIAIAGFLALPAYFTAHIVDDHLLTAGYVAFGMSLLNMAGGVFGPICLLLLPQASKAIASKDFSLLKRYANKITTLTIVLTLIGLIVAEVFTEPLITIYLGESFTDLVLCVRIIMLASIGYTIYISLRSILDAYYVKAINTKNIFIAFFLFIISSGIFVGIGTNYLFILYSFIAGMLLLGLLTYLETIKIFKKESEGNILSN